MKGAYISIYVKAAFNGCGTAEEELVVVDVGTGGFALDVDSICAACRDVATFDEDGGLRQALEHDTSCLEVG